MLAINNIKIALTEKFVLIAGPCVIESKDLAIETAGKLVEMTAKFNIPFIYKSSFDKANRTSVDSYRGLGIDEGLKILQEVKNTFKIPVITDVHEYTPLDVVANVVDILQTPAFLCRQTDFIKKVASFQKPLNIKKGQFIAPLDMINVVKKARSTGNDKIMVCERGYTFGYNNLVADMRSLVYMRKTDCPVIFDASHSTQMPGSLGNISGGEKNMIASLARAAIAVGVAGIFIETHPNPEKALSDGPSSMPLHQMSNLLEILSILDSTVKSKNF